MRPADVSLSLKTSITQPYKQTPPLNTSTNQSSDRPSPYRVMSPNLVAGQVASCSVEAASITVVGVGEL